MVEGGWDYELPSCGESVHKCPHQKGDGSDQEAAKRGTRPSKTEQTSHWMMSWDMLEFIMSTTYFQFDGEYYQSTEHS